MTPAGERIPTKKELRYNVIMLVKQMQQERYFTRLDIFKQEIGTAETPQEARAIIQNYPEYPSVDNLLEIADKIVNFVEAAGDGDLGD